MSSTGSVGIDILASGQMIAERGLVFLLGLMVRSMKANFRKILVLDWVFIVILMVIVMKVILFLFFYFYFFIFFIFIFFYFFFIFFYFLFFIFYFYFLFLLFWFFCCISVLSFECCWSFFLKLISLRVHSSIFLFDSFSLFR